MRKEIVTTVMATLGSQQPDGKTNSRGDWMMVSCPLAPWTHRSGHDDSPSLSVSLDEGRSNCKCFSCQFQGGVMALVDEVCRHGGVSADTASELHYLIILEESRHYEMIEKEGFAPELPQVYSSGLNQDHGYWRKRGYDAKTIQNWGLGYSERDDRVLIPWYDLSGSLVGIAGRAVEPDAEPRYRYYPSGWDKGRYLFGEHRITGTEDGVVVVEGTLDAITASLYLPPTVGVVALGGASVTEDQVRKLALLTQRVYLALDNDNAGRLGHAKLVRLLTPRIREVLSLDLGSHHDPDDAKEGIVKALENPRHELFSPVLSGLAHLTKARS